MVLYYYFFQLFWRILIILFFSLFFIIFPLSVRCLAEHCLKAQGLLLQRLVPIQGLCPKCSVYFLWGDLIRDQRTLLLVDESKPESEGIRIAGGLIPRRVMKNWSHPIITNRLTLYSKTERNIHNFKESNLIERIWTTDQVFLHQRRQKIYIYNWMTKMFKNWGIGWILSLGSQRKRTGKKCFAVGP